jgi:serine/threonine-protein kinase RsbW
MGEPWLSACIHQPRLVKIMRQLPKSFSEEGLMSTLQFTIPSRVDAIGPLMEKLSSLISHDLPPEEDAQVDLALREALANAVIHGNRQDSNKKVHVSLRSGSIRSRGSRSTRHGCIDLIVRDEGRGFDPSRVADPLAEENLLSGHGRGVYLMKAMMDAVRFAKGGKEVHMRKTVPVRV